MSEETIFRMIAGAIPYGLVLGVIIRWKVLADEKSKK
jgi:hypothetical protein